MKKLLVILLTAAMFVALYTSLRVKATASCSVAGLMTRNHVKMNKSGGTLCKIYR